MALYAYVVSIKLLFQLLQVFAGFYPTESSDYLPLKTAVSKLTLNDSSVTVEGDSSPALGQGWRMGFLGLLHMDVFQQRLEEVRTYMYLYLVEPLKWNLFYAYRGTSLKGHL